MKLKVTVDYKTCKVTGNCKGQRKIAVWAGCKENVLDAVRFVLNTLAVELKKPPKAWSKAVKEKDSC